MSRIQSISNKDLNDLDKLLQDYMIKVRKAYDEGYCGPLWHALREAKRCCDICVKQSGGN